ncbi:M20 family peptidase [Actinomyces lilanjuaniae]|uniref:Peptidase M20 domain-containing protein 2 n=1 Tax=Actinomyces lilanjuaniae TaxID=2321394 RepID=A0ABM6Z5D2_9ACTO|nr:amidohydrolase [Actinomyces lilanjuaniae]AYD90590.1 M20 family peptidase [Actinomyces lilanjuaniae]
MRDLSVPTVPSRSVQTRMAQETAERQAAAGSAACLAEGVGAPSALRRRLRQTVEVLGPELVALSHDIHEHPETGYQEYHAVAAVADLLRRHDLEPQVGVYGMDTALRAQVGRTGESAPTIAILCEYDALPGIGHGCGHNVMCASSVGAFLALAAVDRIAQEGGGEAAPLPGRVVLQTTPAEENSTAKEILATRGMLDGVDAAVQTHSYAADVTHQTWLGVRRLSVVFRGVPAHASSQPFMGRNALDAATLALTGFGLLRQHLLPMDRLHAVVVDGGEVANVIPERAELAVMVRSKYPETLKEVVARVEEVLYGAALMTGTGVEIRTDSFTNEMPVRDNAPLLESWVRSQRERGRDPLPAGVLSETIAAGTDFGNVSQRVPGIHPLVKVTEGPDVALHTREMAQAAASPAADTAVVDGAYGLAAVSLDWLCDAGLREAVQADFEASGGVVDVEGFWAQ